MSINKINFKYKFAESYNPVYISGVHGGVTPKGHIVMNCFFERHPMPTSILNKIDSNGQIGEEIERLPKPIDDETIDVVRFVETGLTFDLETAKEIKKWLEEHIMLLEN